MNIIEEEKSILRIKKNILEFYYKKKNRKLYRYGWPYDINKCSLIDKGVSYM